MTEEAKKRRRFKYGLRTFFIVFTVVCIGLGMYGRHLVRLAEQRAAIIELERRGHKIYEFAVRRGGATALT